MDPLLLKIADWETRGYFVDRLKTAYSEGREIAEVEIARFEEDLKDLELLKERYRSMDLSGLGKERQELEIRFQYPHLWFEIKNELDRLSANKGHVSEKDQEAVPAPSSAEAPPVIEKKVEPTPQPPTIETLPPTAGKTTEVPIPETPPIPPAEVKEAQEPVLDDGSTPDQLLDKAKEAYSQDRFSEALSLFKQVLVKDPENSKAKFMIKRISSKMS
jgi:hypothetical protein